MEYNNYVNKLRVTNQLAQTQPHQSTKQILQTPQLVQVARRQCSSAPRPVSTVQHQLNQNYTPIRVLPAQVTTAEAVPLVASRTHTGAFIRPPIQRNSRTALELAQEGLYTYEPLQRHATLNIESTALGPATFDPSRDARDIVSHAYSRAVGGELLLGDAASATVSSNLTGGFVSTPGRFELVREEQRLGEFGGLNDLIRRYNETDLYRD